MQCTEPAQFTAYLRAVLAPKYLFIHNKNTYITFNTGIGFKPLTSNKTDYGHRIYFEYYYGWCDGR